MNWNFCIIAFCSSYRSTHLTAINERIAPNIWRKFSWEVLTLRFVSGRFPCCGGAWGCIMGNPLTCALKFSAGTADGKFEGRLNGIADGLTFVTVVVVTGPDCAILTLFSCSISAETSRIGLMVSKSFKITARY
jgi:hypothetical protein